MKNYSLKILPLLFCAALFFAAACSSEQAPQQEQGPKPLEIESLKVEKKAGPDCDKADTLIRNCVSIDLRYPALKAEGVLKPVVEAWSKDFLTSLVGFAEEPDNMPPLEEAIQSFIAMHDEQVKEMPDGPAYYEVETWDTVLLNDGKYLTLKIDGYSFAGGAHPNPSAAVATWDVASGQKVKLEDLVTDLNALQAIAEKKFREVRADIFKPESEGGYGFNFDETFPFKLADNTGLVKDGIYFLYVPYEVGAYALGSTEFVLSFADIQAIKR